MLEQYGFRGGSRSISQHGSRAGCRTGRVLVHQSEQARPPRPPRTPRGGNDTAFREHMDRVVHEEHEGRRIVEREAMVATRLRNEHQEAEVVFQRVFIREEVPYIPREEIGAIREHLQSLYNSRWREVECLAETKYAEVKTELHRTVYNYEMFLSNTFRHQETVLHSRHMSERREFEQQTERNVEHIRQELREATRKNMRAADSMESHMLERQGLQNQLQQETASVRSLRQELHSTSQSLRVEGEACRSLQAEVEASRNRIGQDRVREEVGHAHACARQEIEQANDRSRLLQQRVDNLTQDIEEGVGYRERQRERVDRLIHESNGLVQELDEVRVERDRFGEDLTWREDECRRLESQLREALRERDSYQDMLEQWEDERAELERGLGERREHHPTQQTVDGLNEWYDLDPEPSAPARSSPVRESNDSAMTFNIDRDPWEEVYGESNPMSCASGRAYVQDGVLFRTSPRQDEDVKSPEVCRNIDFGGSGANGGDQDRASSIGLTSPQVYGAGRQSMNPGNGDPDDTHGSRSVRGSRRPDRGHENHGPKPPPGSSPPGLPGPPYNNGAHDEPIRRDKKNIPNLNVRPDQDPQTIVRTFQTWLVLCSMALSTWNSVAPRLWEQYVEAARNRHSAWLKMTPPERARDRGSARAIGLWTLPPSSGITDSLLRSELLEKIPKHYREACILEGELNVGGIILITMKLALPSEELSRLGGLESIESPLKVARNYSYALHTLRNWHHDLKAAVHHLGARPDAVRLYHALKPLCSDLLKQDQEFAVEYATLLRESQIRIACTPQNVDTFVVLLEAELAQRCHEEVGTGSRGKAQGRDSKSTFNALAMAASPGKRPQCTAFLSDKGCSAGGTCPLFHPRAYGKRCLNCGSLEHRLITCDRPRRPKREGKGGNGGNTTQNSTSKGKDDKGKKGGKGKDKDGRGKDKDGRGKEGKGKTKDKGSGPSAPQAHSQSIEESAGTTQAPTACSLSGVEVVESQEVVGVGCLSDEILTAAESHQEPVCADTSVHGVQRSDVNTRWVMLDTGATHVLAPRDWLRESPVNAHEVSVKVAGDLRLKAWMTDSEELFCESCPKPLFPVGRFKQQTGMGFLWDVSPCLYMTEGESRVVIVEGFEYLGLPYITVEQFVAISKVWKEMMRCGRRYTASEWKEKLGHHAAVSSTLSRVTWNRVEYECDHLSISQCLVEPCCLECETRGIEEFQRDFNLYTDETVFPSQVTPKRTLNDVERKELKVHEEEGHVRKLGICPACVVADGAVQPHKKIPVEEKSVGVLHIDVAGPFPKSVDKCVYFVLCALRVLDLPLLIQAVPVESKGAAEVKSAVVGCVSFFNTLKNSSLEHVTTPRIRRLHTDRGREFMNRLLDEWCEQHNIAHTSNKGYEPQSNGVAERCVGRVKQVVRRVLLASGLGQCYWSFAVRFVSDALLRQALGVLAGCPPFGSHVSVRCLQPVSSLEPRGRVGTLLFYDSFRDKSTYIIEHSSGEVVRAGTPTQLPDVEPPAQPEVIELDVVDAVTPWVLSLCASGVSFWTHVPTLSQLALGVDVMRGGSSQSEEYASNMTPTAQHESLEDHDCEAFVLENCVADGLHMHEWCEEGSRQYELFVAEVSSLSQIEKHVLSWNLPVVRRENVKDSECPTPKSLLFGAYTGRQGGVTNVTSSETDKLKVLHELARHRPPPHRPYLAISVNDVSDTSIGWHRDIHNDGPSDVIALGKYTHGAFVQYICNSKGEQRQVVVRKPHTWVRFYGILPHCVKTAHGQRVSVSYYCPTGVERLHREHWKMLESCGFPVREYWSSRKPCVYPCMGYDAQVEAHALPSNLTPEQARGHTTYTTQEVLQTEGETRTKWIESAKKEVASLTQAALQPPSDEELRTSLKNAEVLHSQAVWSVKSSGKHKCRVVGLGNRVDQWGPTSVSDLDTTVLRLILVWSVCFSCVVSAMDVSTAFLNADLPLNRALLFVWPKCLLTLGIITSLKPLKVCRALYGLKESPKLWADARDKLLENLIFVAEGISYRLIQSELTRSLWLVVPASLRVEELIRNEFGETSPFNMLSRRIPTGMVVALLGIYVDDLLKACRTKAISDAFNNALRQVWLTTEPEVLGHDGVEELNFLGMRVLSDRAGGLLVHQIPFAVDLLRRFCAGIGPKTRETPGESEHFKRKFEDQTGTDSEVHDQQMKLGSLLWLATKTRPDLSWGLSVAASSLHSSITECQTRTRHLIQYLASSTDLCLHIPKTGTSPDICVYTDASFCPAGSVSRSGIVIQVAGASVSWQSTKQPIVALSSSESELIAVTTAVCMMRAVRAFVQEAWGEECPRVALRVDNTSTLVHLTQGKESPWRTKHISLRAGFLADAIAHKEVYPEYVTSKEQLADLCTKGVTKPVLTHLRSKIPLVPLH